MRPGRRSAPKSPAWYSRAGPSVAVSATSCSSTSSWKHLKTNPLHRTFERFADPASGSTSPSGAKNVQHKHFGLHSYWYLSPNSRQDPNTTLHRQTFLERYMSQLTSSVPIGTSAELRQFLDYELQLSEGTPSFSLSGAALQRVP